MGNEEIEYKYVEEPRKLLSSFKDELVGKSIAINSIKLQIEDIASTEIPVLIQGETGTGKELVANAIHNNSPRKDKPFIAINCTALSESLLESELFGHVKGSFTGAIADRKGMFEKADGGTLFLDEIGDMPIYTQAKLLRVIENMPFNKVGEVGNKEKEIEVNVRIVCATNNNLQQLISKKQFRSDLYYRLAGSTINIAPLRYRKKDIMPLLKYFMEKWLKKNTYNKKFLVTRRFLDYLLAYRWKGNVRELKSLIDTEMQKRIVRKDFLTPIEIGKNKEGEILTAKNSIPEYIRHEIFIYGLHNLVNIADGAIDLKIIKELHEKGSASLPAPEHTLIWESKTFPVRSSEIYEINNLDTYESPYGEFDYKIEEDMQSIDLSVFSDDELNRKYLIDLMKRYNNNQSHVAKKAGLNEGAIRSRLKTYNYPS